MRLSPHTQTDDSGDNETKHQTYAAALAAGLVAGADIVTANAIHQAAGAEATLYRRTRHHQLRLIATGVLDDRGNARWDAKDTNGRKTTVSKVRVAATDLTRKVPGATRVR